MVQPTLDLSGISVINCRHRNYREDSFQHARSVQSPSLSRSWRDPSRNYEGTVAFILKFISGSTAPATKKEDFVATKSHADVKTIRLLRWARSCVRHPGLD